MIKLYTTKEIIGGGLVVASTDKDEADDIEGYFCTVEDLRELFEAGFTHCRWGDDNTFEKWLASKDLK